MIVSVLGMDDEDEQEAGETEMSLHAYHTAKVGLKGGRRNRLSIAKHRLRRCYSLMLIIEIFHDISIHHHLPKQDSTRTTK